MIGGDISNEVTPRLLVVYDDVLAEPRIVARRWGRRVRWDRVIAGWPVNQALVAQLWQVVGRLSVRFDVATFLPAEAVPFIREQLDAENVPVANVRRYESARALALALAHMPDVIGVYDLPARATAYGGKGQSITELGRLL